MKESPKWFREAMAVAQVADRLHLSMEEAGWLRERVLSGRGPYHWRVIQLYIKSRYRNWVKK